MDLYNDSIWVIGHNSHVKFWQDIWLARALIHFINLNFVWDPNILVSSFLNSSDSWLLPNYCKNGFSDLVDSIEKVKVAAMDHDRLV